MDAALRRIAQMETTTKHEGFMKHFLYIVMVGGILSGIILISAFESKSAYELVPTTVQHPFIQTNVWTLLQHPSHPVSPSIYDVCNTGGSAPSLALRLKTLSCKLTLFNLEPYRRKRTRAPSTSI